MNPTQESPRDVLEQVIGAETKALEESIQPDIKSLEVLNWKLRRNAIQPISSIPPEIFTAIFSLLCLPGIPSLGGKPSRNRARLRVSHVCRQWCEIALNQPQLWSHIDFNSVSLAAATEILARAKLLPLYMETRVSCQSDDDRFGPFLNQVQAHLPHIRHLSISADFFRTTYWELVNTLVSPAPTLEYLSLSFPEEDYARIMDWQLSTPDTQVLDPLFGGSTPKLSCLKLRNCEIRWNPLLFKGLKYLEILTLYNTARPTLAVWLDTLAAIPQLKTLTLHSASPVAVYFPFDVERTVTLPSLTHLDISAPLQDCALASAHLDLPALTSLCLTATSYPTYSSGVQEFLPYVVRHVHGPQDIRPLQSVLIRNHWSILDLLAWPTPDVDTFVHDPPAFLGTTLPTRVKLSFTHYHVYALEIFEIIMATLPLDGLLTLVGVDLKSNLSKDLTIRQFNSTVLAPPLAKLASAPARATGSYCITWIYNGASRRLQ